MKKEFEKNILKVVEMAARLDIQKNVRGRKPICPTIFHQPKRPESIERK